MSGLFDVILVVAAIVCPLVAAVSPICAAAVLLGVHRRELQHRHLTNMLEVDAEAKRREACHAASLRRHELTAETIDRACATVREALSPMTRGRQLVPAPGPADGRLGRGLAPAFCRSSTGDGYRGRPWAVTVRAAGCRVRPGRGDPGARPRAASRPWSASTMAALRRRGPLGSETRARAECRGGAATAQETGDRGRPWAVTVDQNLTSSPSPVNAIRACAFGGAFLNTASPPTTRAMPTTTSPAPMPSPSRRLSGLFASTAIVATPPIIAPAPRLTSVEPPAINRARLFLSASAVGTGSCSGDACSGDACSGDACSGDGVTPPGGGGGTLRVNASASVIPVSTTRG